MAGRGSAGAQDGGHGYVLDASGSTWLYEYLPRSTCPRLFQGEATHMDSKKFQHDPISTELKAKFAVWAFTVIVHAREKADPVAYEEAMKRADLMGRYLTLLLRGEAGPGPVLVYVDQWRDPCGGTRHWQVTDEGEVQPYRHEQEAGYVIDCEEMGEWAMEYRPAGKWLLSSRVVGEGSYWYGQHAIPRSLIESFCEWYERWRECSERGPDAGHDWKLLNDDGLVLARELKTVVGTEHMVIYLQHWEEPGQENLWGAVEVLIDGSIRKYVHSPYWSHGLASEVEPSGQT